LTRKDPTSRDTPTFPVRNYVNATLGNYVNDNPLNMGNSVNDNPLNMGNSVNADTADAPRGGLTYQSDCHR
jgi:hypothetical protein